VVFGKGGKFKFWSYIIGHFCLFWELDDIRSVLPVKADFSALFMG